MPQTNHKWGLPSQFSKWEDIHNGSKAKRSSRGQIADQAEV